MTLIPLKFNTNFSRARIGLAAYYRAMDGFLHDQLRRRNGGVYFADYRAADGSTVDCWLTPLDLRQHTLVLGATGSGKSSLLEAMIRFHFQQRRGVALLDPHGDLFVRASTWARHYGTPNVTLLDFTRPERLPSWNPLAPMAGVDPKRQVDLLLGVLKRLYADEVASSWAWGVKVYEILRQSLTACIESDYPATLPDVRLFLLSPRMRREVLATASEETQAYFRTRFGAREEMYVSGALNRIEPFLGAPAIARFLGDGTPRIDLVRLVDEGSTILVNLAKGYLGLSGDVLGRLIMNSLQLAVLRRERQRPSARVAYSIIVDEAHNLAGVDSGLEDLLVAARKYRVSVALAAQGLSLFPPRFRPHLLGNTGRQFFFRLSPPDARAVAPEVIEPLGATRRVPVRPYDTIDDPLLTPNEEIAARTRGLSNLPVGSCYWLIKGRRFRGRRIQVRRPPALPKLPPERPRVARTPNDEIEWT